MLLHELMHKNGMHIPAPSTSGAKYERSIENAMIEMQRVLLKGITGRVCKGYDVN